MDAKQRACLVDPAQRARVRAKLVHRMEQGEHTVSVGWPVGWRREAVVADVDALDAWLAEVWADVDAEPSEEAP